MRVLAPPVSDFPGHRATCGAGRFEVVCPVRVAPRDVGVGLEPVHRIAGVVLDLNGGVGLDELRRGVAQTAGDGAFEDGLHARHETQPL